MSYRIITFLYHKLIKKNCEYSLQEEINQTFQVNILIKTAILVPFDIIANLNSNNRSTVYSHSLHINDRKMLVRCFSNTHAQTFLLLFSICLHIAVIGAIN